MRDDRLFIGETMPALNDRAGESSSRTARGAATGSTRESMFTVIELARLGGS